MTASSNSTKRFDIPCLRKRRSTALNAVSDDDYLRLCAYDDERAEIAARNGLGPVWLLG